MQMLPVWAPNIHPIVVHLPIAALLLAVFFDFLSLIFKKQEWISKAAVMLYVIGAIGAVFAVFTGKEAAEHLMIPKSMYHDIGEHAEWGKATAWFFGIYAALRLLVLTWRKSKNKSVKFGLFIISLVGVFLLVETGDHGAKLVFKHGIGTVPLKQEMIRRKNEIQHRMATIPTLRNGGWIWTPGPGSPTMLASDFSWYKGGPQELHASTIVARGDTVLTVNPDSSSQVLFSFGKQIENVRAEIEFDPMNFKGTVSLANHIVDANNLNFLQYHKGNISAGSVVNGEQNIVGSQNTTAKNWITMSLIINNGQITGMINGKKVLSGEAKMNQNGVTGVGIQGNGLLLIRRIEISSIQPHDD